MQKIGQLNAFVRLSETEDAVFRHPDGMDGQARYIRFRVLAESPVQLFVRALLDEEGRETEEGEVRFLTYCDPGLDQIEFYYEGGFALQVKGGIVWLDTFDNTSFYIGEVSDVSFARLWEREERDPAILEIERLARYNQQRLQDAMKADMAKFRAELESKYTGNVNRAESNGSNVEQPEIPEGSGVSSDDGDADDGEAPGGTGGKSQADA